MNTATIDHRMARRVTARQEIPGKMSGIFADRHQTDQVLPQLSADMGIGGDRLSIVDQNLQSARRD